jgi:hypothetical protein
LVHSSAATADQALRRWRLAVRLSARNLKERPQRRIDCLRVRKRSGDVWVKHKDVRSFAEPLYMLSSDATAQELGIAGSESIEAPRAAWRNRQIACQLQRP